MATRKKNPQEEIKPVARQEVAPIPKATDTRTATPIPAAPPFPTALSGTPPIAGYNPTPAPEAPLAPLAPTRPVAPPIQRESDESWLSREYPREMAMFNFQNLSPSSKSVVSQAQGNTQGVVGQGPRSPLFSLQPQAFSNLQYQSQVGENSQFRNISPSGDILNRDFFSPVPRSYTPRGDSIFAGDTSKTPQPYAPFDNKPFSLSETGYQRAGVTGFMSPIVADNRFVPNQGGFLPSSQAATPATTAVRAATTKIETPYGTMDATADQLKNYNAATARRQQEQAKEAARAQAFETGMERAIRIGQANAKARQDESINRSYEFRENNARKKYDEAMMDYQDDVNSGRSGKAALDKAMQAYGEAEEYRLRRAGEWDIKDEKTGKKRPRRSDEKFQTEKGSFRKSGWMGSYELVPSDGGLFTNQQNDALTRRASIRAQRRGETLPEAPTQRSQPQAQTEISTPQSAFGLFSNPWGFSPYGGGSSFLGGQPFLTDSNSIYSLQ